ncbi:hypothetical protein F751_2686 [Auxenochlorella protothecoides]|uniref:Uncharacterized protein n=1 Tax=Auxenochlorella protothecoides TaxID=3075 RepID=A0A087SL64_AUXPR|nr:hypothetical protein F751_2686 [Auxenochlorella protothecoides]KFM26468.1 hypothetical protein F751_2686 [Auxenochlorella protothecoides]
MESERDCANAPGCKRCQRRMGFLAGSRCGQGFARDVHGPCTSAQHLPPLLVGNPERSITL